MAADQGSDLTLGAPALVTVRGASKRFGATQALDKVDLDVRPGSVLALLGQNGAGKSTIIKVLAGIYSLDSGEVTVCGAPLGSPDAAGKISFIHQDLGLVAGLSVAENVALGTGYPRRAGLIGWSTARRRAERALEIVGSTVDPRARVADLSRTDKSLVAIGRALVVNAKVLVLDEPTASLPVDETHRLFTVLRRLRDQGLGLVYVSHRLDEVFEIADHVTIMRDGAVVADARLSTLDSDQVIQYIVGRKPIPPPPPAPARTEHIALAVSDLVGERVGPVSLEIRAGEVVGLVGLAGAGHVELGRTVLGDLTLHSGQMTLQGRRFAPKNVAEAVGRGLGFVTSNRPEEGLAMPLTLTENLRPNPALTAEAGFKFRRNGRERAIAADLIRTFGVRPADPDLPVAGLSGGNQQKVILGRWLSTKASVLILEEPTAGVDVGAKHEIYTLLDAALARGVAVLLISTDFEEVAAVCHRALVFKDGQIVREIAATDLSVSNLVAFASGAAA
ncbi:ribose transport system ATP-binding protein [Nakamurella sp. UYEF19]|uniref:sugar ABC transporter ATP-binding protein n=1 Tax=Nakamurella sp. UYEF19 TaxID=1756392 RepID=UPI003391C60E